MRGVEMTKLGWIQPVLWSFLNVWESLNSRLSNLLCSTMLIYDFNSAYPGIMTASTYYNLPLAFPRKARKRSLLI